MILVTGASGFVGANLVRHLRQEGRAVRGLVRNAEAATELTEVGAETAVGDVTRPATLAGTMAGVQAVIHLVAVIREDGETTFERVNVQGTQAVVEAAEAAGVHRIVYMSALGAVNDPQYPYLYSKWRGEEAVRASHLRHTILRPSVIVGSGFGFVDRVIQGASGLRPLLAEPQDARAKLQQMAGSVVTLGGLLVIMPAGGRARFQPIWIDDLATCVLRCLDDDRHVGQTYALGGPEHLTYAQIVRAVVQTLGWRRVLVPFPTPLMKPAVWAMERTFADPPATLLELAQLDFDNITDFDSVERAFGFKPRRFQDGLAELLREKQRTT